MKMTCKEVESQLYGYDRKAGDTGKNLVTDMLKELADAIGFDTNLLKENQNANKAFCFDSDDVCVIKHILEAGKSKEGKRLRCRDYNAAGGFFVDDVCDSFLNLAAGNGVLGEELYRQALKMCIVTDNIAVRECIRNQTDEFEHDIDSLFFMDEDKAENGIDDDHMDGMAKQVFLEFLLNNIDEDINYIRGVYWCFVTKKQEEQYLDLKSSAKYLRQLSDEQRAHFKTDIRNHLSYEKLLNSDESLAEKIKTWSWIENGNGKLQDNKKRKSQLLDILEVMKLHADRTLQDINDKVPMPEQAEEAIDVLCSYQKNCDELSSAAEHYKIAKNRRSTSPLTSENETMLELGFRQRFGTAMF